MKTNVRNMLLIMLATTSLVAQTAFSTKDATCPFTGKEQIMIAVPVGTISTIPVVRQTCVTIDPLTLVIDKSTSPWTLKTISSQAVPVFVDAEVPIGVIDGVNNVFTLGGTPNPLKSLLLLRNGVVQKQGFDYTIVGNQITFVNVLVGASTVVVPIVGDGLEAWYRK